MVRLAIAFLLCVAPAEPPGSGASPAGDAQARDRVSSATGTISGRVTDRETGQPLARVSVTLGGPQGGPLEGRPLVTHTDADGRYAFTQLAPGPYSLTFAPPAHRATHLAHVYGERQPLMPRFRRPYPISLGSDQRLDNADVALWRAFAISGRVIDENGDPMVNVDVHAYAADGLQVTRLETARASDDRGAFRLFGLPPGRYQVCAEPRFPWQPVHAGLQSPDPPADVPERPIRTCHPSAVMEADAQLVSVTTGDAENVDIRVGRSRVFRVTGSILSASGAPFEEIRPEISVVRLERRRTESQHVEVRPGGRFVVRGLVPGDYLLRVDKYGAGEESLERELARVPFSIDSSDLEGLVVVMEKPARVTGRVVFEEPPAARQLGALRVFGRMDPSAARLLAGPDGSAAVRENLTFELFGLYGPRLITMTGLPRNYYVKRVTYGTEDITDTPFDFQSGGDPQTLEILLSNRGAFVTGTVLDEHGNRAADTVVLVFSADRTRWGTAAAIAVRLLVPPRGPYTVGPLRQGDYFIAAVSGEDRGAYAGEPEILEQLAHGAERIMLGENERRTLDLRVTAARGIESAVRKDARERPFIDRLTVLLRHRPTNTTGARNSDRASTVETE